MDRLNPSVTAVTKHRNHPIGPEREKPGLSSFHEEQMLGPQTLGGEVPSEHSVSGVASHNS